MRLGTYKSDETAPPGAQVARHRQQLDPTYEFDTPVRDGGKAAGGLVTDEIGGSIGDLAPAGLTDAKKDA